MTMTKNWKWNPSPRQVPENKRGKAGQRGKGEKEGGKDEERKKGTENQSECRKPYSLWVPQIL